MAQDQAHACDLASLVKTARHRARLTQKELAHQADVHQSYISKIERQHRSAPGLKLLRVGEILDIPAATLMHAILHRPCPHEDRAS